VSLLGCKPACLFLTKSSGSDILRIVPANSCLALSICQFVMRTTKSITISLPPEQLRTAERLAKKQSRTMSELFREALRRYQQEEEWRPTPAALNAFAKAVQLFREDARRAGLSKMTMRQINAEVAAARKEMRARARNRNKRSGT